jgi:hypothetical protein
MPDLVADLSQLLAMGTLDLPHLAYAYARCNRDVAGTAAGDALAFGGGYSPKGDGGTTGTVHALWSGLRNTLQDAIGETASRSAWPYRPTGGALPAG